MIRIVEYVGRYEGFRGRYGRLPSWARLIVTVAAVPGILLVGLSIVALVVSILALLLLTTPVYWLLSALTAGKLSPLDDLAPTDFESPSDFHPDSVGGLGRRRVDVRVVDGSNGNGNGNGAGNSNGNTAGNGHGNGDRQL
jgi:hypothetical protein